MKKNIVIISLILLIIIIICFIGIWNNSKRLLMQKQENKEYEQYLNKEI